MPYVKCSQCHHEWETVTLNVDNFVEDKCDWCGAPIGRVLEETTPFERMMKNPKALLKKLIKEIKNV